MAAAPRGSARQKSISCIDAFAEKECAPQDGERRIRPLNGYHNWPQQRSR